jgi:meiotically up-regulated gene 157 (Mug157) protein
MERSKTLILKLRNPQYSLLGFGSPIMPQDDIERMIDELGKELTMHITDAVHTIRDETKRARPQQGEENYELKMLAYQKLLVYITQIMNTLTKVFSHAFTEYRRQIDQLWDDIQRAQNEDDVQGYVRQFLCDTERMFRDAVTNDIEPLFEVIESKLSASE